MSDESGIKNVIQKKEKPTRMEKNFSVRQFTYDAELATQYQCYKQVMIEHCCLLLRLFDDLSLFPLSAQMKKDGTHHSTLHFSSLTSDNHRYDKLFSAFMTLGFEQVSMT